MSEKKQELPITFDIVREKNLESLKLLNNVIFPIKYAVRGHTRPDSMSMSKQSRTGPSLQGVHGMRGPYVHGWASLVPSQGRWGTAG